MKYKAVVVKTKGVIELVEKDLEEELPKNTLLIKCEYASLNNYGKKLIHGNIEETHEFPLGIEGIGKVINSWSEEGKKLIGKRVGYLSLSIIDSTNTGTVSEYAIVNENLVIPLPEEIDPINCVYLASNALTSVHLIEYIVKARSCKGVIFDLGTSKIGRMIGHECKRNGIDYIAIVRSPEAKKAISELGYNYVADSSEKDFLIDIKEAIDTVKPTVYIVAACAPYTSDLFAMLPEESTMCIIGNMSDQKLSGFSSIPIIHFDKEITGFSILWSAKNHSYSECQEMIEQVAASVMKGEEVFTQKPDIIISIEELLNETEKLDFSKNIIIKI